MEVAVLIVAILIGLFVVGPTLLKGNEEAQKALEQVRLYQGIIGVVVGIFAVVAFIVIFLGSGYAFWGTILRLGLLAAVLTLFVLGFLMAYQLLSEQVLSKSEGAKEKADAFRARWEPRQSMLGWIAFGSGLVALIAYLIIR